MTIAETAEGVPEPVAQTLRVISSAMALGLTAMAGLVAWTHFNYAGEAPAPERVRFINTMTTVAMGATLAAVVSSELLWRSLLRGEGALSGRVQVAFIARLAAREGAGLLGLTVGYLAAANGTLKAFPAYWVNLAPFGLFLGFLAAHWPTGERLACEAKDVLGGGRASPQ